MRRALDSGEVGSVTSASAMRRRESLFYATTLRAMYTYVTSLSTAGTAALNYLPSGKDPATPAIVFQDPPHH